MLLAVSIRNFAIIEQISLDFQTGMTVLTGETGAGKSIIIDAMNMMLGARATTDAIRHGADKAEIEGFFSLDDNPAIEAILEEQGIDSSQELIIRREIFQNGRSVSRINGQMVNLTVLKAVGQHLVDIHGQHDQEELMKAQYHIAMLDQFGDEAFQEQKAQYEETFDRYKTLRRQVLTQQKNEQENKARIEMLRFQLDEIESAELEAGEDERLQAERDRLINHKNIADTLTNAFTMLDDEDLATLQHLRSAMNDLQSIEDYDADYKQMADQLAESYYVLDDVAKRLGSVLDNLDFDGNRLMLVESRLDLLNSMTRKYGGSVDDVLTYYQKISEEYQLLTGTLPGQGDLEQGLKQLEKDLVAQATALSQARHDLAKVLESDIKQELKDLYMEKADFQVTFTKAKFSKAGNEQVEFYISTNPGEGFKPLVKVASGGELSRLMLAIKSAFSRKENKTSIVFDEVDTGVSGRVAQAIAQKIYKIGQAGQVLAISHLPQVIAIADYQFFIEKVSSETSTVSQVRLLTAEERVEEIAKMIAGDSLTPAAIEQARTLLQKKK
ncbi:DNA repair protein RecN [Streptococcus moroccensis]|uniref:DNA repair protein RecN n=1 Tax=Streptococcus moroccensis TaxID=1451356 RepID=A0ABT9YV53_9STRE|nr:DNA repair protein RecN [Streptococcus moroccensis]MDQ0223476.1 DNA repair protein RecN (Recombination protein N) [Streptococcus moroccensis]